MATHAQLATIRKLSQYRPFEGGGRDSNEAQEDLLLAALAEAGGSLENIDACRAAISTLFTLQLDDIEISRAFNSLLRSGTVVRLSGGGFSLSPAERTRLEEVAAKSRATGDAAFVDWFDAVEQHFPGISEEDQACLRDDLEAYLRIVIQRHGAEAALLLYPDEAEVQRLYDDLEELGFDFLERRGHRLERVREYALSQFMRNPTGSQRAFLSQILNTGYFWTVLSIDPEGTRLIQDIAEGQRVYLDTNFVFRLLGIQGPRYIRPAEIILELTQALSYETCVTPWTIDELRRSLRASRDFLKKYPVPPSDYAALAADATSEEDFVTLYWRRVRDEPGLTVDDFSSYYEEIEVHLEERNVRVRPEGCTAVEQREQEITDQVALMDTAAHGGRLRPTRTIRHDVMHRLLITKRRGEANRSFATAGAWFLTHDSVLPRYDNLARAGTSELPFCVSAGSWFQVVEAFNPKSGDLGQALADMIASPYVRYRRTLSKEAARAIVARTHLHADGTPELAARVLMNSAAISDIERAESQEEEEAKIDSALLAAAQEVQEEARLAKAHAEAAQRRAQESQAEAAKRISEAEQAREDAVARERALREDAVRAEQHRAQEAARNEAARSAATERKLGEERDLAQRQAERQEAITRKTQRRLRLLLFFIVAVGVFMLVALLAGLSTAWAYVVALGGLLGAFAAVDHFMNRADSVPPGE